MIRNSRGVTIFTVGCLVGVILSYTTSIYHGNLFLHQYTKETGGDDYYNYSYDNNASILHLKGSAGEPLDSLFPEKEQAGNTVHGRIITAKPLEEANENSALHRPDESIYPESHACSLFGRGGIPSAVSIWRKHLSKVVPCSKHPVDSREYLWHDFTARLLNYMSPERLQRSVKALPQDWNDVGHILDIINNRWKWIDDGRPRRDPEPRKVNIMVMGGSVALGVRCAQNPVQETSRFGRKSCSWSNRLNLFLNAITGKDLFNIENAAMGGTNTATATNVWDYSIFPDDTPLPDIVINAYATNDMHVNTVNEANRLDTTLEKLVFQMNEQFVRTVLSTSSAVNSDGTHCEIKAPLLLYYDDYLGNEQKEIHQILSLSRAINTLSTYYGFGFISYADTVRDLVFSNTNESWFSPDEWPNRNIHPGMGMHISSVWILAFNFLVTATTYCEMPTALNMTDENQYIPINGLPLLRKGTEVLKDHPMPKPPALPPKLDQNLTLDNVSKIWQDEGNLNNEADALPKCNIHDKLFMPRKCLFAWMGNSLEKTESVEEKIKVAVLESQDWKLSTDHEKTGYLATQANAKFVLKFTDIDYPVATVNLMVMTSYGKNWEGSKIRVDTFVIPKDNVGMKKDVGSMDISGYHDKETSETFVYKLKLGEKAEIGDGLLVEVQLIGGVTFKITGMAICSK